MFHSDRSDYHIGNRELGAKAEAETRQNVVAIAQMRDKGSLDQAGSRGGGQC